MMRMLCRNVLMPLGVLFSPVMVNEEVGQLRPTFF